MAVKITRICDRCGGELRHPRPVKVGVAGLTHPRFRDEIDLCTWCAGLFQTAMLRLLAEVQTLGPSENAD